MQPDVGISQTRVGPNPQHEVKSVTDTGKRKDFWTKLEMHPRLSVAGSLRTILWIWLPRAPRSGALCDGMLI
jgi:hypothetical protein